MVRVAPLQSSRLSLPALLLGGLDRRDGAVPRARDSGIVAGAYSAPLGLAFAYGQSLADLLARDAGIRRRVEVLQHEDLPGPMTCGVLHPAIVLPRESQTWDAGDLHRAIVHELEHVRRADWATQCLARMVCAAYWFHPLVWMTWRRLCLEAERSCDDAVLGGLGGDRLCGSIGGTGAAAVLRREVAAAGDGEPFRSGGARGRRPGQPAAARPRRDPRGRTGLRRGGGAGGHGFAFPHGGRARKSGAVGGACSCGAANAGAHARAHCACQPCARTGSGAGISAC